MTTKISSQVIASSTLDSLGNVAANGAIYLNSTTISANYTLTGQNGMSVGPITIASGANVTVASGSRWVVL
jgi:hypothetical protein